MTWFYRLLIYKKIKFIIVQKYLLMDKQMLKITKITYQLIIKEVRDIFKEVTLVFYY